MTSKCKRCNTPLEQGICPRCPIPAPPPPEDWQLTAPPPLPGQDAPPLPQTDPGTPKITPPEFKKPPATPEWDWPKAGFVRRGFAFLFDALLVAAPAGLVYLAGLQDDVFVFSSICAGLLYWLFRDSLGASIGKLFAGLRVVKAQGGGRSGIFRSFLRNLLPLVLIAATRHPLLSSLALLIEPLLAVFSRHGRRLGDIIAGTQVIGR